MDKKIYSALLIGLGDIGLNYDLLTRKENLIQTHAKALHLHSGFELLGGVDIDIDACSKFTKTYDIESFNSLEDALLRLKPDLVILAIPTQVHLETIKKIIRHHKPLSILCEKPMGGDLGQCQEITQICKKLDISLYTNYIRTCMPGGKKVKELIETSIINSPMKCVVWYSKGLKHNGSHFINLMSYWFGNCIGINVIDKGRDFESFGIEPYFRLIFEKCEVTFIPVWEEFYSHYTVEIISSNGRLYWGRDTLEWTGINESRSSNNHRYLSNQPEILLTGADKCQMYVADELYSSLSGKVSSICNAEQSLETQTIIDKVLRLAQDGI